MDQNASARRRARRNEQFESKPTRTNKRTVCGDLVKLDHYCKLTGDTRQAVHSRRKRGQWLDGKHCYLLEGRRLWIDINEVNAWVRGSESN